MSDEKSTYEKGPLANIARLGIAAALAGTCAFAYNAFSAPPKCDTTTPTTSAEEASVCEVAETKRENGMTGVEVAMGGWGLAAAAAALSGRSRKNTPKV